MGWRWLLILAACSDGAEGPADVPDASAPDAATVCTLPPGVAHIVSLIRLLPSTEGFDLDGDGTVDNRIAELPPAYFDAFNQGVAETISSSQLLLASYITGWSDPPTPDDDDAVWNAFHVWDADNPEDPSNDFSGMGEFLVPLTQFDLSCRTPDHTADTTEIAGGVMTATIDPVAFPLSATGTLIGRDGLMVITFASDFTSGAGTFGGWISLCSASALPYPGASESGSVLDVFANDPNLASLQPDIDEDGDGIERVEGDGVTILRCFDGDGTEVGGSDCPCHPDIADGFSLGLHFDFLGARILGVLP